MGGERGSGISVQVARDNNYNASSQTSFRGAKLTCIQRAVLELWKISRTISLALLPDPLFLVVLPVKVSSMNHKDA